MMVRPSEFGMIQQINEVSQVKQNEMAKPGVEQQNLSNLIQKNVETKAEQVQQKDNADNGKKKFDAKDKSDNEYQKEQGKKEKKKSSDGRVFIKGQGSVEFDMKI